MSGSLRTYRMFEALRLRRKSAALICVLTVRLYYLVARTGERV